MAIYSKKMLNAIEIDFKIDGFHDHAWWYFVAVFIETHLTLIATNVWSTKKVTRLFRSAYRRNHNLCWRFQQGGQQILISIFQVYSRYFQMIFLVFPGIFMGRGVPEHICSGRKILNIKIKVQRRLLEILPYIRIGAKAKYFLKIEQWK